MAAYLIDYIVFFVLFVLFGVILGFSLPLEALDVLLPEDDSPIYYLYGMVGFFVYDTMLVGTFGTTIGKAILGIRIVRSDGRRVGYGRAAGRYFAEYLSGFFLGIGFLMVAFNQDKRGLHDLLAGTVAVRRN